MSVLLLRWGDHVAVPSHEALLSAAVHLAEAVVQVDGGGGVGRLQGAQGLADHFDLAGQQGLIAAEGLAAAFHDVENAGPLGGAGLQGRHLGCGGLQRFEQGDLALLQGLELVEGAIAQDVEFLVQQRVERLGLGTGGLQVGRGGGRRSGRRAASGRAGADRVLTVDLPPEEADELSRAASSSTLKRPQQAPVRGTSNETTPGMLSN